MVIGQHTETETRKVVLGPVCSPVLFFHLFRRRVLPDLVPPLLPRHVDVIAAVEVVFQELAQFLLATLALTLLCHVNAT